MTATAGPPAARDAGGSPSSTLLRENCIVQVVAEQDVIQTLRPFNRIGSKLVAGSGVIIDAREGLVISNAHVTENSVSTTVFSGLTGKMPLHCELLSILREKDLSLLRILPEDRKVLLTGRNPEDLNARPVDHLSLRQGCYVYAAGFPLGTRHLQVTTGCLSGLSTNDSYIKLTQYEDALQREPTFIVTSAGLNHGMSGGGLFDENGGLVGIITAGIPGASQIGFAIPSRVVLANYGAMLNNITPIPSNLHFRWSNVSRRTSHHLSEGRIAQNGMMIRHVLPDSVFHGILRRGDLLQSLEFDLPKVHGSSLLLPSDTTTTAVDPLRVVASIESHGDISLTRKDGVTDAGLSSRKFSIPEIVDYMATGSQMRIRYNRGGEEHNEDVDFKPNTSIFRVRGSYHVLESPDWLKIGGVVMQNTSLNNLAECSRYKYITEIPYYDDFLFTPSVLITYVEPSSEVGSLSAFSEGDIVVFVDGKPVRSIDEVKKVVAGRSSPVAIETDRGAIALCSLGETD